MGDETFKVDEYVRLRHGDRIVVLRPGDVIPAARAAELGLAKPAKKPAKKDD